jgi:hypothetical protein
MKKNNGGPFGASKALHVDVLGRGSPDYPLVTEDLSGALSGSFDVFGRNAKLLHPVRESSPA